MNDTVYVVSPGGIALPPVVPDSYAPERFAPPTVGLSQLFDEFMSAVREEMPYVEASQLQQLQTLGWVLASNVYAGADRNSIVYTSRLLFRKDPLAHNAIRIWE